MLASFDKDDNVIDLYVNSPTGLVASYHENDPDQLYYYQTDQIGSPRVITHSPGGVPDPEVAQYINYHPFGQVSQSFGSFDSPLKFTGKEQDNERDFEFHYFGARYYDARIGMFTSVDRAGQFAGGYLYGGNNPVLMIDPDGNESFWEWLGRTAVSIFINYAANGIETGQWGWDNNLKYSTMNGLMATGSAGLSSAATDIAFDAPLVPGEVPEFGAGSSFTPSYYDATYGPLSGNFYGEDESGGIYAANKLVGNHRFSSINGQVASTIQPADIAALIAAGAPLVGSVAGATVRTLASRTLVRLGSRTTAKKGIGLTGKIGEKALKSMGGTSQAFYRTSSGGRFIDQLVKQIGCESKVGYTNLTVAIRTQIAKDAELLAKGQIKGATWHFFRSPVTGEMGASAPLTKALREAGIDIIYHF